MTDRANSSGWKFFAIGCMLLLVFAVGMIVSFGIPGSTGDTSDSQQQTSGAAQPEHEIRDGHSRQNTTGYGSKADQPQPQQ